MTASADITVIPTGGVTAIDLADIAASIEKIPTPAVLFWLPLSYSSGGDSVSFNVAKQTGNIEDFLFQIDGTTFNPVSQSYTHLPDGLWSYILHSVPNTSGSHTVQVTCSVTGATDSATYSV
jgi:hypothetical protein